MAEVTLASLEGFDCAYLIKHYLSRILWGSIPLLMFRDSEALFKVLLKSRYTTEKRLMVDISAAREARQTKSILTLP